MSTGTYFPGHGSLVERNQQIGKAEGRVEGKLEDAGAKVLHLLDRRGVTLSEAERQRVLDCKDLDVLDVWFDRAITAGAAVDVFVEPWK